MFRRWVCVGTAFVLFSLATNGQEMTITRLGTAQGGSVDDVTAVYLPKLEKSAKDKVITAVRSGGKLKLIAWHITEGGKIDRLGTADAGSVDRIAAVALPKADMNDIGEFVTAIRSGGKLALISWNSTDGGKTIKRLDTYQGGTVDDITAVAIPKVDAGDKGEKADMVTAVRTGRKLALIAWNISKTGKITRLGTTDAGSVDQIATVVVRKGDRDQLVTAVRSGGDLRMISWHVTREGKIERLATTDAGSVDRLAAVSLPKFGSVGKNDKGDVITAVRTSGHLRMISWYVTDEGKIERLDTADGGSVDDIAEAVVRKGDRDRVFTAVRAGGHLRVIVWHITEGGSIERLATADAGSVDKIAVAALPKNEQQDRGLIVTAVRSGGDLTLISWLVAKAKK